MENTNIIKQAKSDIFTELYPIINFYVKKGATPQSLKKYYRNSKRFSDILDDIKHKGSNLITDDTEYKKTVRITLDDILNDLIAKEKDEEYTKKQTKNMKHIKEFNSYGSSNESILTTMYLFAVGYFFYKFLKSTLKSIKNSKINRYNIESILIKLTSMKEIPILDLNDRYFIKLSFENEKTLDIRISKESKIMKLNSININTEVQLTNDDYDYFLTILKTKTN